MHKIMVVDEDASLRDTLEQMFRFQGLDVVALGDAAEAAGRFPREQPDVVVVDFHSPRCDGTSLLEHLKSCDPRLEVIMLASQGHVRDAVAAMRSGAYDFLPKPPDSDSLLRSVQAALEKQALSRELSSLKRHLLSGELERSDAFTAIVTRSRLVRRLFHYMEAIRPSTKPLLLVGETGVGKGLFARAFHELTNRGGEFVPVNVGEMGQNMFSDVLFGHQKGAFTGADRQREGLVRRAEKGTLFLDGIGDLSPTLQVKLLRMLQEGEFFSMGGDVPTRTNARIVAATNRSPEPLLREGALRRDLYYRLSAHEIHIPPLRDRPEDIEPLLAHFLGRAAAELGKTVRGYPRELPAMLEAYDFPGNVRELKSMVYDAVATHRAGGLSLARFRTSVNQGGLLGEGRGRGVASWKAGDNPLDRLKERGVLPSLKEARNWLVEEALRRAQGRQAAAASILGISRQALNRRVARKAGSPRRKP